MKILKKIISAFGYKLIEKNLIQNERVINEHPSINPQGFIEELIKINNNFTLIQIGANDGVTDDFLSPIIKKKKNKSIIIKTIKKKKLNQYLLNQLKKIS